RRDLAAEMIEVGVRTLAANMDGSLAWRFQPDHQIEECGFAAAGLPDDRHHFARCNGEIEAVDCNDGLSRRRPGKNLAQAAHFYGRWAAHFGFHARHRNKRASARATIASSKNSSATNTSVQAKTSATENSSCATDN